MPRIFVALLFALGCALVLAPAATVRAANGTISGQLIGQNGAANIVGTTITLDIATVAGGKPATRTTQAGADGSFRFDGFTFNQNAVYLLKVVYEGGSYFREVEFPAGQTTVDIGGIEVFPATRDESGLSVPRMNTIFSTFDPNGGGAQGIETGAYANAADRAFVGRQGAPDATTFRFGLPQTATGIQPAQGLNRDTLVPFDEPPLAGFAMLDAVTPGEHQFAFIYRVETRGDLLDFDRVFPYKTGLYSLYLPVNAKLTSSGGTITLRDSGEQTLQNGQRFRVFTANDIPAGGRLAARFSGMPTPGSELNPLVPAMLVFVLLIGIGLIVVYGRRRGPSAVTIAARQQVRTVPGNAAKARTNGTGQVVSGGRSRAAMADTAPRDLAARKEALLLELVDLDERHESGELPHDEYRRLRRARKEELVATLRALGETGGEAVVAGGRDDTRRRP